jgi:hypothetical protein
MDKLRREGKTLVSDRKQLAKAINKSRSRVADQKRVIYGLAIVGQWLSAYIDQQREVIARADTRLVHCDGNHVYAPPDQDLVQDLIGRLERSEARLSRRYKVDDQMAIPCDIVDQISNMLQTLLDARDPVSDLDALPCTTCPKVRSELAQVHSELQWLAVNLRENTGSLEY